MRVSVDGCRLFVDVEGLGLVPDGPTMRTRPTMLVLHGGPGLDHTSFKPRFSTLTDVAQLVYVDHRGQGRSDRSSRDRWTMAQWADDIVALCDALGIVEPVVYGVSFGSMVALEYAVRHPGHASKIILDSTSAFADLPSVLEVFERLGGAEARDAAEAFWTEPTDASMGTYWRTCMPLYVRHPQPDAEDTAARGLETANFELFQHWSSGEYRTSDLRASLDAIVGPLLILAGEDDPITPAAGARDLADLLGPQRCRLEVYADCGHGVWCDQPEAGFAAIRAFVGG